MSSFLDGLDDIEHALSKREGGRSIVNIPLDRISSDPDNPRKLFDDAELHALAESIKERGLLQPITVRTLDEGKTYIVRFGDRRFRAAQIAELAEISAIVTEDDAAGDDVVDQIIENDQRVDLSTAEMAAGVMRLIGQGLDKKAIAQKLGRPRADVSMLAAVKDFPETFGADFIERSPLRAVYDLYVAWKKKPEEILGFIETQPEGTTVARATAFVRSLKEAEDALHVQREVTVEDGAGEGAKPSTPARKGGAAKAQPVVAPVSVSVRVGDREGRITLTGLIEVSFSDGTTETIPAEQIEWAL
jgi:ParB family chromosome partitioning protein